MKNTEKLFAAIPLFICSFLPLLTLILHLFGYSVSLVSYEICSVILAIICIASVYLIKQSNHSKSSRVLIAFLPLIQLVNAVLYVKNTITAVFMAICFIACAVISEKVVSSNKAKVASVITSMLLFVFLLILSFARITAGNFELTTVVKTVESPNGEYYAEIVDSDEGALGGDTFVYVKKADSLNLLILKIEKYSELVYHGEWREYKTMEIKWLNDNTLLINSTEYKINT